MKHVKKLAKYIGYAVGVLVVCGLYWWWSLFPPQVAPVPARGGTLTNVTLIQPGSGRQLRKTIRFEAGIITAIEDATGSDSGLYVLPGLVDMHVHQPVSIVGFEEYFALLYLMHGVTSVRDLGYTYPDVFERRRRIEQGEFPGPRTFTCGTILDGSPPLWENATVVATPGDADMIVAGLAAEGADCIKVYSNLKLDVLDAIHAAADKVSLPVIGHIPSTVAFEDARLADVQHMIGIPEQSQLPRGSNPFANGWEEMSDERVQFIIDTSLQQRIAHTPTLVFLDYNARRDKPEELREMSGADFLPRVFADEFWKPEESFRLGGQATPELYAQFRRGFEVASATVARMHASGVKVHAGTDAGNPFVVPGISVQRELRLLVEAGLTPEEALATATTVAGESLRTPMMGRLQVGAPADMLVFSADPTVSLDALDSLQQVITDGRMYQHEDLQREVERYRQHFHNFAWDRVVPVVFAE